MNLQSKRINSGKWWLIIKLILAISALWFIYERVFRQESSGDYLNQLQTALRQDHSTILFIAVFVLMLMNWSVEAMKWKYMIAKIESVSMGRALEAVLSGITISFFTPNRIGEYAGRVFHLREGRRMQAVLITVIENCSQLLITIIAGCVACTIYLRSYLEIAAWMYLLLVFILVMFCILCIMLFYNLSMFENVFTRFRLTEYWKRTVHVFSLYTAGELSGVIALSFSRYVIFSLQFYILLMIYGCTVDFFPALLMIAMTFFVMSVVPTFAIAELGVRAAIATYFFNHLTVDPLPALNATFSLWLINLAIPAIVGAIFIFNFRLEKNNR